MMVSTDGARSSGCRTCLGQAETAQGLGHFLINFAPWILAFNPATKEISYKCALKELS